MITKEEALLPKKEATEVKERVSKEDMERIVMAASREIQTILEKYNCKMVAQLTINEHRTVSQTFIKYIIEDGETA